jgi:ATP-dependent RNA helicase DDX3X
MDSFDTQEMAAVLPDTEEPKSRMDAAAAAVAREKGWVEPEKYDYAKYNAPPVRPVAEGAPTEVPAFESDLVWASDARKYEWKEEYGDVGPEDKDLEQQLFRGEFINRAGVKFEKYVDNCQNLPMSSLSC